MITDLNGSRDADDAPIVPGSTHEEWHPYSVWREKIRKGDTTGVADHGTEDEETDLSRLGTQT